MASVCELSGEPLNASENSNDEVVVTPSGHVCKKRLLLSKLADNGGYDPFVDNDEDKRPLSEDELITLKSKNGSSSGTNNIQPPRPHVTSVPSILTLLQKEYDSILLELFDTRKQLESTRKELSQALYQNDAAVRVVARLSIERDQAKEQLNLWNASTAANAAASNQNGSSVPKQPPQAEDDGGSSNKKKRKLNEENEQEEGDDGEIKKSTISIPDNELSIMVETWGKLSKERKAKVKATPVVKDDDLSQYQELYLKSCHKSSCKGITAISSATASATSDELIVTAGLDKQIIVYSIKEETILYTISGVVGRVTTLDINDKYIIAGIGEQCLLRLYNVKDGSTVGDGLDLYSITTNGGSSGKKNNIVDISLHPDDKHFLVTTQNGIVTLCSLPDDDAMSDGDDASSSKITIITQFDANDDASKDHQGGQVVYTCGALHPDGLLYGAGTNLGTIHLWDLKNQKKNLIPEGGADNDDPITCITFSENGYHVATGSNVSNKVCVWDLRKQNIIVTLNSNPELETFVKNVNLVTFDAAGKHLAYGGDDGNVIITTVKKWDVTAKLSTAKPSSGKKKKAGSITGIIWNTNNGTITTCSNTERSLRFYGLQSSS